MRIGGFQRFSLSDFPGRVSAIVFAQGCNFRCPFCHNGGLIPLTPADGMLIPEEEVLEFLSSRRGRLDGVVISGGEPTLQPDLPGFISRIRDLGLAVKLDTNGSRPDVLSRLISEGLVDYIAMDVKAPVESYGRLAGIETPTEPVLRSISIISRSGVDHEFRTTRVSALLSEWDLIRISDLIPPGSRFTLQQFRAEDALDPSLRAPAAPELPLPAPQRRDIIAFRG